ncbi:MAG: hypothetical protein V1917_03650 [Candidatus Gottesmanbacteria bacterium]
MKNVKLVTFVPMSHADVVRKAMGDAGAGIEGKYIHCSFSTKGTGRFSPQPGSNPTIGTVGKFEEVEEERIEVTCEEKDIKKIIAAIKSVHPYEEVPINIYPLLSTEEL